jgi:hypothetical protein
LEGVELNGNSLVDSGTTVYNGGTNTVGDGTTSADHQLVSTDSITQIETGVISSSTTIAGATDDGWGTVEVITETVNFSTTFDSTPRIFLDIDSGNTSRAVRIQAYPDNVSTTGFDAKIVNYGTGDSSSQQLFYMAIEL